VKFLLAAIAFQVCFGQILKWSAVRGWSINAAGLVNYVVAAVAAGLLAGASGWQYLSAIWTHALFAGVMLALTLLGFNWLVPRIGISLPAATVRAAITLPVVSYILFGGERPSLLQLAGVGLIGLAVPVVGASGNLRTGGRRGASMFTLACLFLTAGSFQLDFRMFQRGQGDLLAQTMWPYMTIAFGAAAVVMVMQVGVERPRFDRKVCWAGVLLGLANVLALAFFLKAMEAIDRTYVVFPLSSCGGVIATTLLAVLAWGERLDKQAVVGLGLAVTALGLIQGG